MPRPNLAAANPEERHNHNDYTFALRQRLEALIEAAIAFLDGLDAAAADLEETDPAEEDCDAEPSLAAPTGGDSQIIWCAGCDDDREINRAPVEEADA
jgi:hypothetical protein